MELRPYQAESISAVYDYLRSHSDNPCIVIPTGGGKTPVLASICKDTVLKWGGRILILAHVRELLEQAVEKLELVAPELWNHVGVYSAGLNRRDTEHPIIIGGIQSVYKRACELGAFDLIIVDEAHMIPVAGEGMYRTFLEETQKVNPDTRVIGLTATPFRMSSGTICAEGNILNEVCYEIGVKELIDLGFICPLISKGSRNPLDTSGLHVRAGEFISTEVEELMDTDDLVEAAVKEIFEYTRDRKSVLIFASGVAHGKHIVDVMKLRFSGFIDSVFGDTLPFMRDEILADFRSGHTQYLVNVNVLTMGFDAPNIDCVVMVRPTMSPGLYYQMVGRGFRMLDGKADCLVLDFGGNILRHGPVDKIKAKTPGESTDNGVTPQKTCPECQSIIAAGFSTCPDCGFKFPDRDLTHDSKASTEGILSGQTSTEEYDITSTTYHVHHKRGGDPDAPRTMRVDYATGWHTQSEWVCVEHSGYAREKACNWWRDRAHGVVPRTADEAVALAHAGALCETLVITVKTKAGEKFSNITEYELGPKPEYVELPEPDYIDHPDTRPEPLPAGGTREVRPYTDIYDDIDDIPF